MTISDEELARLAACAAAVLLGVAALGWQISRRETVANVQATDAVLPDGLTQLADPWLETTGVRDALLLSPIDEPAGSTVENLDGLLTSSAIVPQSADLEDGATRLPRRCFASCRSTWKCWPGHS